ncbi:hypothetical protein SNEBB_008189, partial [Seison nebaliae]
MFTISDYPLNRCGFNENFCLIQEPQKKRISTVLFLGLFLMLIIGGVMGGVIGGIYGSTDSSSGDTSDNVTSDTTLNTDVESVMSNFLPADCTLT